MGKWLEKKRMEYQYTTIQTPGKCALRHTGFGQETQVKK